jgi:cbb3-type cytochrome oxidase subunit 3
MNLIIALLSRIEIKDIVALLILFMQLIFLIFVIYKAQKRADFDVANFLRDENGKESSTRAFAFLCLAVMSWGFAMLIFLDRMTEFYFFVFGGLWAGTPVAMEMVKRWDGSVPFGSNRTVPHPHSTRQDPSGSADNAGGGK